MGILALDKEWFHRGTLNVGFDEKHLTIQTIHSSRLPFGSGLISTLGGKKQDYLGHNSNVRTQSPKGVTCKI